MDIKELGLTPLELKMAEHVKKQVSTKRRITSVVIAAVIATIVLINFAPRLSSSALLMIIIIYLESKENSASLITHFLLPKFTL